MTDNNFCIDTYTTRLEEMLDNFKTWRVGQCCFNALFSLYPDHATAISGTDCDPWEADDLEDPKLIKFRDYIQSLQYNVTTIIGQD